MSRRIARRTLAAGALILGAGALVSAQTRGPAPPQELRAGTAETSDGESTGGNYTLTSAVHQPIAELSAPSTGGSYSLQSGILTAATAPAPAIDPRDAWLIR